MSTKFANQTQAEVRAIARMVSNWEAWVHRRVETVSILDENRIRRHVSVDFDVQDTGATDGTVLVPLTLLRKRPLRQFNVFDEGGRTLPVLTTTENGAISRDVLVLLAGIAGISANPDKMYRLVVAPDSNLTDETIGKLLGKKGAKGKRLARGVFRSVARELASSFLLIVRAQCSPGSRRIFKYEYESIMEADPSPAVRSRLGRAAIVLEVLRAVRLKPRSGRGRKTSGRLLRTVVSTVGWIVDLLDNVPGGWLAFQRWLGLKPVAIRVDVDSIALSRSCHVEVAAPHGLAFHGAQLMVRRKEDPARVVDRDLNGTDLVHLHLPESIGPGGEHQSRRGLKGRATLLLGARPDEVLRQAYFVSWLTAIVLTTGLLLHELGVAPRPDAAAAVIVAFPSLFAVYLAAPGEHRLAQQLVRGIRDRIWLTASIPFAAGGFLTLAFPAFGPPTWWIVHPSSWRVLAWWVLAAVALVNCLVFLGSLRRARRAISMRLRSR